MNNLFIASNISIRSAMKTISKTAKKCLVVTNRNQEMLGILSDGDIRKALLKGALLSDSIKQVYNSVPKKLLISKYDKKEVKKLFLNNKFDLIPVVDEQNRIEEILVCEKFFKGDSNNKNGLKDVPVIIMAGGKGTRLKSFTTVLPKPLIPVHGKPIIQHFSSIPKLEVKVKNLIKAKIDNYNHNYLGGI